MISLIMLALLAATAPLWSSRSMEAVAPRFTAGWISFQIDTVTVSGYKQLTKDSICALAEIPYGDSPFECKPLVIRAKLETHPWIEKALVYRKLPDELVIEITERIPIASLRGSDVVLLTADGVAIPSPSEDWVWDLPIITPPYPVAPHVGTKTQDKSVLALLHQLNVARRSGSAVVPNISEFFVEENEMRATLIQPPLTIRLGNGAEELNWIALPDIIEEQREILGSRTDITVDMRIPGSIIVSKQQEEETSTEEQDNT